MTGFYMLLCTVAGVLTLSAISFDRWQHLLILGINKYTRNHVHKISIKYKELSTRYQDAMDPGLEKNMTTFPLQLLICT